MTVNLFVCSLIFSCFVLLFILFLLKKQKITIKYSLVWFCVFFFLTICLLIPGLLDFLTKQLGFQTPSNMVFSLLIASLIIITIALTVIVSTQDKKIRLLIQEISILKKEANKK